MKEILIICYSPLHRDPRVITQITALKENNSITCGGYTDPNIEGVDFIELIPPKGGLLEKLLKPFLVLMRAVSKAFWINTNRINFAKLKQLDKVDLIISNELNILPIAYRLSKLYKCKLILDAHEYYPGLSKERGLIGIIKNLYTYQLVKKYFQRADHVTTVGENIKKLYIKYFNINSEVIMNLPSYEHQGFVNNEKKVLLVHHGHAMPGRELERMIDIMNYLDEDYSLTFYLMVQDKNIRYFNSLKEMAKRTKKEIYFKDPIPTKKIPFELNTYDIGVYILPPTNINNKYALPNKLFEFIQARLAIAIGPSPEMARVVKEYELGVISEKFTGESLAFKIKSLNRKDILKYKKNSNKAAASLSSKEAMKQWNKIIDNHI